MATLNDFVFLAATRRLATTQRKPIVMFPLPQCLYERIRMLRYTYIAITFWNWSSWECKGYGRIYARRW